MYYEHSKYTHYEHSEISQHLMDRAMKQSTRQFHKKNFHISKCFACNAEKNITVEDNKKENEKSQLYKYIFIKYILHYM